MTAPRTLNHAAQHEDLAALTEVYAYLRILACDSADCATPTDSAAPSRPIGAVDQLQTQDDRVTRPRNLDTVAMEDATRDALTNRDV